LAGALDPTKLQKIVDLVNQLAANCLKLRKHLHKSKGDPILMPPVTLTDPTTSVQWSAELADNLAGNNANVRDSIWEHDKIRDQQIWPDPGFMASGGQDDLLNTIVMWLQMDVMLFEAMLTFYPIQLTLPHQDCPTMHDGLNELANNAVAFISVTNSGEYSSDPITIIPLPKPPADNSANPASMILLLAQLEHSMHKLVQGHMQIATFIPAHLRFTGLRPVMK
jgi:hypothetical protein